MVQEMEIEEEQKEYYLSYHTALNSAQEVGVTRYILHVTQQVVISSKTIQLRRKKYLNFVCFSFGSLRSIYTSICHFAQMNFNAEFSHHCVYPVYIPT